MGRIGGAIRDARESGVVQGEERWGRNISEMPTELPKFQVNILLLEAR